MGIVRRIAQMIIFILIGVELGFQYQYEYIPYKEIKDLYVDEGVWRVNKDLKPSTSFTFELGQGDKHKRSYGAYGDSRFYRHLSGKKIRVYWDYINAYRMNLLIFIFSGGKQIVEVRELDEKGNEVKVIISRLSQLKELRARGRDFGGVFGLMIFLVFLMDWPNIRSKKNGK